MFFSFVNEEQCFNITIIQNKKRLIRWCNINAQKNKVEKLLQVILCLFTHLKNYSRGTILSQYAALSKKWDN